ncbi:hypothetical protein SBA5_440005 [Candidatus Sulfotelmatomonas gaucii]|uniref:Uncharacterized protein n=1 Tax=Candidatus Sulfuritelmatomonas gaucii TaxID=2043161 RepID=A0A2N9LLU3_9BACT|nr:hypothetical protein SBA5_440005 [Candidatus Sulfotelmatomonas gaucii]
MVPCRWSSQFHAKSLPHSKSSQGKSVLLDQIRLASLAALGWMQKISKRWIRGGRHFQRESRQTPLWMEENGT